MSEHVHDHDAEDEAFDAGFGAGYTVALEQGVSAALYAVVHADFCDCCIGGFDPDFYVQKMLETVRADIETNNKEHKDA